jgi:hypothetical protein
MGKILGRGRTIPGEEQQGAKTETEIENVMLVKAAIT